MRKLIFGVLLFMTGCASLGLAPAQSFDDKLAYAYGTHTGVLLSAHQAETQGAISKDEEKQVLMLADQAQAFLDGAKAVEGSNPTAASNNLTLALNILIQVQTYLTSQGSKP